jgi:hypothetical protein
MEIFYSILFGISLSVLIPFYIYFILRRKFSTYDSAALAAAYGSVSAVTFVTGVSFLESHQTTFHGHMVAIMALMESPAIVAGIFLLSLFKKEEGRSISIPTILRHSLTNGSVFLIIGSLIIGFLANPSQAEGIKPFTNDIFKGFLAIFLLDMGISSGKKLDSFLSHGWFPVLFAILIPLINGCCVALMSGLITQDVGNKFMFGVLAASASYIAVPAAMRLANPKADPGLYLPMALAITFPMNITVGMPLYLYLANL